MSTFRAIHRARKWQRIMGKVEADTPALAGRLAAVPWGMVPAALQVLARQIKVTKGYQALDLNRS